MEKAKALLVEDDPNWRKIFGKLIADNIDNQFEFIYATDLASGIKLGQEHNVEIIFLDLILPDSDALNTIKVMTSTFEFVPIIIVSTLDDEMMMKTAFANGVEDYLVKDQYDPKTFFHISRQAIQRSIGKASVSLQKNFNEVINKLKSIDKKISALENLYNKNHH